MAIDFGPKLNLFINADINEVYYDAFRPFLIGFDSLVQATVISAGGNTAPSSPANGDAYIVGTSPTGTWQYGRQRSPRPALIQRYQHGFTTLQTTVGKCGASALSSS